MGLDAVWRWMRGRLSAAGELLLIWTGWRDIRAAGFDARFHDIIAAYGQALRCRIAGAPPPDPAIAQALLARVDAVHDAVTGAGMDSKQAFSTLCEVETRYLLAVDEPVRLSAALATRERFARVAAPSAIAAREQVNPVELTLPWTAEMTADTLNILNYIHARYIMNIARETAVARVKSMLLLRVRRVAFMLLLWLVGVSVIAALVVPGEQGLGLLATDEWRVFAGLTLIFVLGYLGSIVSVSQRFQKVVDANVLKDDPVFVIGGIAIASAASSSPCCAPECSRCCCSGRSPAVWARCWASRAGCFPCGWRRGAWWTKSRSAPMRRGRWDCAIRATC